MFRGGFLTVVPRRGIWFAHWAEGGGGRLKIHIRHPQLITKSMWLSCAHTLEELSAVSIEIIYNSNIITACSVFTSNRNFLGSLHWVFTKLPAIARRQPPCSVLMPHTQYSFFFFNSLDHGSWFFLGGWKTLTFFNREKWFFSTLGLKFDSLLYQTEQTQKTD